VNKGIDFFIRNLHYHGAILKCQTARQHKSGSPLGHKTQTLGKQRINLLQTIIATKGGACTPRIPTLSDVAQGNTTALVIIGHQRLTHALNPIEQG
jgi:hypothetical protein